MAHDVDGALREYLLLKDEVARLTEALSERDAIIEELTRPRHWTQAGPRGHQATALHEALDRVLERAVAVRDVGRPRPVPVAATAPAVVPAILPGRDVVDGCYGRLRQAADLLGAVPDDPSAFAAFTSAVAGSSRPPAQLAWLGMVAVTGRYPTSTEFDRANRALRSGGVDEFRELLEAEHRSALAEGAVRSQPLVVRPGAIVVDVTHTATHDLHTGIQRVVRETVSRWLSDPATTLVWWDTRLEILRQLGDVETYRFREWETFLPAEADTEPVARDLAALTPDAIVVPWDGTFLLPELAADPRRSSCFVAMLRGGVVARSGAIGFDLVPVTSAETVHEGMVAVFPRHLSVVKYTDRVSAISESAADEFRGLWAGLRAQGLRGPDVEAHTLPPTPVDPGTEYVDALRERFDVAGYPVVLVVGSREPRKNQITILEAARTMWRAGERFHLVMIGGSGWNADDVNDEIDRLRALGMAITVRTRAGESELFAWYRIARFTVFPSLHEGFGLPIAESLGVGTPVITANFGSTAEVAAFGGALVVDPRDPTEVRDAMERLLHDDELLAKLRAEAADRTWPSWDEYARDVFDYLVARSADADRVGRPR